MRRWSATRRGDVERGLTELLWRRAAKDREWFFTEFLWVPSQRDQRGREPMQLFDHQADAMEALDSERYVIVLKARQLGWSTLAMALTLHTLLFTPGAVVLVVSKNQEAANKAISIIKTMHQFLPGWMKHRGPTITADSTKHIVFSHPDGMKSRVKSFAGTATVGAGETATLVVLDEFALMEDQDNVFRTLDPTTDAGGKMLVISTARGAHNRFARMFRGAQKGDSKFHAIFNPWHDSPFVDKAVYDTKKREFADEPWLFYAEYPADPEEAFRESGRPRFPNLPKLDECVELDARGFIHREDERSDVEFIRDTSGGNRSRGTMPAGPLRLVADYEHGKPDSQPLVFSVDPASGIGGDFTAGHLLTWTVDGAPRIVGYWHANTVSPVEAAEQFYDIGEFFDWPLLVVEKAGGWGDTVINELQRRGYPQLYRHVNVGNRSRRRSTTVGFPMHWTKRPLVIDRLAEFVRVDPELGEPMLAGIHPKLRMELGQFVRRHDGKVAADVGCHDDLVMSVATGLWVLVEDTRPVTTAPKGEARSEAGVQKFDLTEMFDQVEVARSAQDRARREFERQARRAIRASRRR